MSNRIRIDQLCAVVVTFNPDTKILDRLEKIRNQMGRLVIVDNDSDQVSRNALSQWIESQVAVSGLFNAENVGLGKAMNDGIELGMQENWEYFCTFDQDSEISGDYSRVMIDLYEIENNKDWVYGCSFSEPVKLIGRANSVSSEELFTTKKTVISSGMLFAGSLVKKIGNFRADYFIDSIDHEFCLRVRSAGGQVIQSTVPLMHHKIGGSEGDSTEGRFRLAYEHSPLRKYYMSRNTILTVKRHWKTDRLWALKQLCRILMELTSIVVFEREKAGKIRSTFKGLMHGIRGLSGPDGLVEREIVS